VAALMDRAEVTQALDRIWQRVRRLNRYVEEQAPWVLARDPASSEQLDRTLSSLVEGLRTVNTMLEPYMPATTHTLRTALGSPGGAVTELEPLFPKRG
jgi:methionyl-tRNA synthetase